MYFQGAKNQAGLSNEEIDRQIAARNDARENKDFAAADAIRESLLEHGVELEDSREGTRWRRV